MHLRSAAILTMLFAVATCGPGGKKGAGPDAAASSATDSDGDTISDVDEGRAQNTDTDGDGIPDYLDTDSDNDGIPDYREAGDADLATPPFDSDSDGKPDYRDTDSDDNGRADGVDGVDDTDNDGKPDFADLDDDGDGINDTLELGADVMHPVDTDGDGKPDFRDTDSDNDTIPDLIETAADYDMDGIPNFRDLDSDGDCIPDQAEANGNPTRDTDGDGHYDFQDRDSDDDGLLDSQEDKNCNGVVDTGETSATNGDTDGDGAPDLVEVAAGTDPTDPASNPQANGDFVFIEPYTKPQSPIDENLAFATKLQKIDVYVMVDRSGSMSTETGTIKNNLATVIKDLECPPLGNGNAATCIPDLYSGLGAFGYQNTEPFTNYLDIQQNPNFAGVTLSNVTGSNTKEPETFALWSSITGSGTASASSCTFGQAVAARTNCPAGTYGYPCFRDGALPVIVLATDEEPISTGFDTYVCPGWNTVKASLGVHSAKVVGAYGSGSSTTVISDMGTMASDTGAVDASNGNAPLVFNGADATAATAIENGIRTLANNIPLDMNAVPVDDPSDSVDALAAFFDHLETLQLGTAACANGLTDIDTNGDTFKDKYLGVKTGTPVCWKVVSKPNTTVPATDNAQLYKAFVTVYGDGITALSTRNVWFLVPPAPVDIPVN